MAESSHSIPLHNGLHMPLLGLGTFLSQPGEVGPAIKAALHAGYRHLDCAEGYYNQKEIGQALAEVYAEGKITRKDIWITSKLDATQMHPDLFETQINTTLADLQTNYLDLYLVHQPVPCRIVDGQRTFRRGVCVQQIWRKMEELVDNGKAKSIGVSNFPTAFLNDLLNYARIKPVINQIEVTPYLTQKKHINFCRSEGIEITSYGALGAPGGPGKGVTAVTPLLSHPLVVELAAKKHKTPGQILIRYHIDGKVTVIPKSTNPDRIKENFNVWDFSLTQEELAALDNLNQNFHLFDQAWHGIPTFT